MSSNRTHNRAFEKAKQAFFEEGKRRPLYLVRADTKAGGAGR